MSATEEKKRSIFDYDSEDEDLDTAEHLKSPAPTKKICGSNLSYENEGSLDQDNTMKKPVSDKCSPNKIVLTAAQRAKMEHNRQRALLIRQEKLNKRLPKEKYVF